MTAQIIKRQYDEGEGLEVIFLNNNTVMGKACTVAYNDKPNAFLHNFKVKEQYRGKGYGTQILKYMIENFGVNTLYVNKNSEAIKLYERFGFETVDIFDNKLVMQRSEVINNDNNR
jgi:ribosomal protein S18 acetylase RimI-like enzyme